METWIDATIIISMYIVINLLPAAFQCHGCDVDFIVFRKYFPTGPAPNNYHCPAEMKSSVKITWHSMSCWKLAGWYFLQSVTDSPNWKHCSQCCYCCCCCCCCCCCWYHSCCCCCYCFCGCCCCCCCHHCCCYYCRQTAGRRPLEKKTGHVYKYDTQLYIL